MINFNFSISNPRAKENFKSIFSRSGPITKTKVWEFEIIRYNYEIVEICFKYTIRQDHAGPLLTLGLFGYSITIQAYDTRHWDYTNNCWLI